MYTIRRRKKPNVNRYCYSVVNTQNDRVFSKCARPRMANRQLRKLRAIRYSRRAGRRAWPYDAIAR